MALGAVGFNQQRSSCLGCSIQLSRFTSALLAVGLSPIWSAGSNRAGIYWLIAIPVGLTLAIGFFSIHRGLRPVGRLIPVAVGGVALLAALVGLGYASAGVLPGDLTARGLIGLIVLSLAMLSTAVTERNWTLALLGAGAVAMAFVANLYDIKNITGTWLGSYAVPNLILAAFYFFLAALVLGIPDVVAVVRSDRWRSRPLEPR